MAIDDGTVRGAETPARSLAPPRVGRRRGEPRARKRPGRQGSGRQGSEPQASEPQGSERQRHPVFVPLSGFFTGLALVIVVPAVLGAVLSALFDRDTAAHLLPFGLAVFAVPAVLLVLPRSRRFGLYLLLGMIVTAIVVIGVAVLTLLFLLSRDG